MYNIIQKRKIWYTLSSTLVVFSIVSLLLWGLKFGIDFTGGSLLELKFSSSRPTVIEVKDKLSGLGLDSLVVQIVGEENMILRFQNTEEAKHQEIMEILAGAEELRFDSVGPSIGAELKSKTFWACIMVIIAIIIYVAWAFRKISKPVASWKYGLSAVIALFHDVLIVLGAFAIMGKFLNVEINTPFIAAILTVLGYSVNDTIVVFDRIRERLPKSEEGFEETINTSVNQTITRSINTSFTTLLTLLTILIFGGESIRDFALALAIGVTIGTYSSILLASPFLIFLKNK